LSKRKEVDIDLESNRQYDPIHIKAIEGPDWANIDLESTEIVDDYTLRCRFALTLQDGSSGVLMGDFRLLCFSC